MKKIYCDVRYCMNCRRCEWACYLRNSEDKDVFTLIRSDRVPVKNIDLIRVGDFSFPFCCRQCDEPECVNACISGALYLDEENEGISFNPDKCVGCSSCVMKCPYGTIKISFDKAVRCDLCFTREIPECVAACPVNALILK
jgi:carbon-monoxide dehydrogenase iron sulfur subunit